MVPDLALYIRAVNNENQEGGFGMKKVWAVLCLSLLFSITVGLSVRAEEPAIARTAQDGFAAGARWQNISSITIGLSINNGRALMTGTVTGDPGTTRISVDASLARLDANRVPVEHILSWRGLVSDAYIWAWSRPHYVARGHYYRLTLVVTVTRNGVNEVAVVSTEAWAS